MLKMGNNHLYLREERLEDEITIVIIMINIYLSVLKGH